MAKQHSPRFLRLVEAARAQVREVSAETLKARLERGERFTLIDVREDNEWGKGHIPQAQHLGRGVLERDVEKLLPDPGADVVLYCSGGFRSALAAEALGRMGYTDVKSLAGGSTGWLEKSLPFTAAHDQ